MCGIVFYYLILCNFKTVDLLINPVQFKLSLIEILANNKQVIMNIPKQEIRQLGTFFYLKRDNEASTSRNINDVYKMETVSKQTIQN